MPRIKNKKFCTVAAWVVGIFAPVIRMAVQFAGAVSAIYIAMLVHGGLSLLLVIIGLAMGVAAIWPVLEPMTNPGTPPSNFGRYAVHYNTYFSLASTAAGATCYLFHEMLQAPTSNLAAAGVISVMIPALLAVKAAFVVQNLDAQRARR